MIEDKIQSRQRVKKAIHFNAPDKIPVMHMYLPAALYQHGDSLRKIWAEFSQDFGDLSQDPIPIPPRGSISPEGEYYEIRKDDWDVEWECSIFGILGHPLNRPLDDLSILNDYNPPKLPPTSGLDFETEKIKIKEHKKQFYCRKGWVSIFEIMHAVRRFEDVLMDIYDNTSEINQLANMITDYWSGMIDYYLKLGVDGIQFGDDYGTQNAMMLDINTWRRFFKPRYAELTEQIKKAGKDIFFHSCGHTLPLVDDFADIGVNVFWPQMNANDNVELAKKCRERHICLMLHFDRQKLMPFGTPVQIDQAVKEAVELFGDSTGGIILYGEIDNDFPLKNIYALYQAFEKYR